MCLFPTKIVSANAEPLESRKFRQMSYVIDDSFCYNKHNHREIELALTFSVPGGGGHGHYTAPLVRNTALINLEVQCVSVFVRVSIHACVVSVCVYTIFKKELLACRLSSGN